MADILKLGGSAFHPSAANTGNEQPTVLRGKNMILRGSNGSYYFECFGGIKDLEEPIPTIALTGTIAYTSGSLAIVGTGTDFKNELRFGQKFMAGNPSQVFVVEDTFDAENMTVQRAPDATASGQIGYKLPHLQEIHNQRGTQIWGNAQKFDRGNYIAVGEGQLRLNGDPLQGEPLYATRRLKLAIYDPATGDFSVDGMGFTTTPTVAGVSISVVAGGSKDMTQGFYSFMWAWADSRTGYGFSNPSDVIKLDASADPIEITATNQRFRLDFTAGLASKPIKADAIIVYRSLFSDPTQNVTQTGEGSWYVAKTIKIDELESGDILYLDVLDGELGTEVSFDNDVPPEADWVSVLGGDVMLISCYGDTVVGGGDRGSAPGPFISPQRRGNRHGFPAALATVLSPPEQIIGFSPALGRLFLMTRVGLPFAASTGEAEFPVETRAFWTTRFKSPYGLVFYNDAFYAFTVTGATRAIGTADKAQEQIDFSDAVSDITRNWFAGYVHAAYDPQNEMIVFIYSAAYRNDDGWWVSLALPYSLLHQCWMPLIEITKPDRDMVVSGTATVGSYLQFLAGGRGFSEEIPSEESSEAEESSEEPGGINPLNPYTRAIVCTGACGTGGGHGTFSNVTSDTDVVRGDGTHSWLFESTGTRAYWNPISIGGWAGASHRFYINFETLPDGNTMILYHAGYGYLSTPYYGIAYHAASQELRLGYWASFSNAFIFSDPGIAVATDVWYEIDFKIEIIPTDYGWAFTMDGTVNSTPWVTQTVGSLFNIFFPPIFGEVQNDRTLKYRIADVYSIPTHYAWPLGSGHVRRFVPVSDGVHNIASPGDFKVGAAGADITNATTTSFGLINDLPMDSGVPDTDDYINQAQDAGDGTAYVEHVLGSPGSEFEPLIPPRALDVLVAYHAEGTGAGSSKVKLNDDGEEALVADFTGAGSTSLRFAKGHFPNALNGLTGWTLEPGAGDFSNLRTRFGYSLDGDPDQYLDSLMVEAEFREADIDPTPYVGSIGTLRGGSGDVTVTLPTSAIENDILILFTESGAYEAVSAPAGWTTLVAFSGNGASNLGVFWKRHDGSEIDPVLTDSGNHTMGQIIAVRGCITSGDPWDDSQSAFNVGGSGTASLTITGVTTTVPTTLVIYACTSNSGTHASGYSAVAAPSLTDVVELVDGYHPSVGGHIFVGKGHKATAGATGNMTLTFMNIYTYGGEFSGALKPAT